jgi:amino-acid N-acetyltransferase
MPDITFKHAVPGDMPAIIGLLKDAELPYEDVDMDGRYFIVAAEKGKVIGVVGLEASGDHGLLRSLAVEASHRNEGLGKELLGKMILHARRTGVKELYLLTTTADKFFAKQGFEKTDRAAAPAALRETYEFMSICPVSAVCMKKNIDKK